MPSSPGPPQPFVPADFNVPENLETPEFRIRTLTVNDVVKDYDAVMTSVEHLKTVWPGSKWPEGLTFEQDLIDLGWHQKEFQIRRSFAYTVVTPSESQVIGCVYIEPTRRAGFDAEVFLWARQSELAGGLDAQGCTGRSRSGSRPTGRSRRSRSRAEASIGQPGAPYHSRRVERAATFMNAQERDQPPRPRTSRFEDNPCRHEWKIRDPVQTWLEGSPADCLRQWPRRSSSPPVEAVRRAWRDAQLKRVAPDIGAELPAIENQSLAPTVKEPTQVRSQSPAPSSASHEAGENPSRISRGRRHAKADRAARVRLHCASPGRPRRSHIPDEVPQFLEWHPRHYFP